MGIKSRVKKMEQSLDWRDWLPEGVSVGEAEAAQRELAERLAEQALADDGADPEVENE